MFDVAVAVVAHTSDFRLNVMIEVFLGLELLSPGPPIASMSPKMKILLHLGKKHGARCIVASGRARRLYCHMTDTCLVLHFDERVDVSLLYVCREDEGQG